MAESVKPWKIQENRLRATAKRRGMSLYRSRTRDPYALDYGKYWLIRNITGNALEAGVTLDDIEKYLTGERPNA